MKTSRVLLTIILRFNPKPPAITTSLVDTVSTGMLLKLIGSGKIKTATLVTHTFSFAEMLDAYSTFGAVADHKAIKVIIDF
ncbi:hypothetical protein DFH08DRAFT_978513 [Mycena albidolilacea]|uniref:Alcohol dehydrogenase n=1 Tax=Mycena albidolilacea TaxID=1033008 RepID=A0AAD7E8C0_9AGAR|nr:hypothetical protein DFH08DRAFT_978513 [Mycena albidolilacea]